MAAELIRTAVDVSTNTVHDVFVQYSPHVQWLSVDIWIDGWFEGEKFHKEFILLNDEELIAYNEKHQTLFDIVNEQIKLASNYEIKQQK